MAPIVHAGQSSRREDEDEDEDEEQSFLERWVYDEPSPPEYLEKLRRCEAAVSVAVTNTDGFYTLNYGQIDGRWHLIVIDHVTPCDA